MRAIRIHEFGDPEVMRVEELPEPQPVDEELLVRIHAVGVNPVETYVRSGIYSRLPALPYTPGTDAAGVETSSGARVYVTGSLSGTYADYALCHREQVFPLPTGVTFAQGAALGTPYTTAFHALFQRANAQPGETVLVHGASGGVGIATMQFAAAAGLSVVGSAGSDAGLALVAGQGSVGVVDHRDPDHLARAVELSGGRGFDVIVEMRADLNLGRDLRALAPRGRVIVVGSRGSVEVTPRDLMNTDASVRGMLLDNATPEELTEAQRAIAIGLRDGSLRPVVGRELPLTEAPRGHHVVMERPSLGKVVLVV
ncbi:MAG: NADPH:quinone reductase [Thermoleophilia bacterium]